jgi:hypothetical protein
MASYAASAAAMPQVLQSEQLPVSPRLTLADSSTVGLGGNRLRPLEGAECSLCGVARPLGLLVPDGGQSCADVRWYCKDVKSCTERWMEAARAPRPALRPAPFVHGLAVAAPAERPDGLPEEAPSVTS